MDKEEREVFEVEMRQIDECDVEKISTLGNSEKMIATRADRWWPQKATQEGDKVSQNILRNIWKNS